MSVSRAVIENWKRSATAAECNTFPRWRSGNCDVTHRASAATLSAFRCGYYSAFEELVGLA